MNLCKQQNHQNTVQGMDILDNLNVIYRPQFQETHLHTLQSKHSALSRELLAVGLEYSAKPGEVSS